MNLYSAIVKVIYKNSDILHIEVINTEKLTVDKIEDYLPNIKEFGMIILSKKTITPDPMIHIRYKYIVTDVNFNHKPSKFNWNYPITNKILAKLRKEKIKILLN